jgi:hypothetical protein
MEIPFIPDHRPHGLSLQDHLFGDEPKKPLYDSHMDDETILEDSDFKKSGLNNASTKPSLSPAKVIEPKRPVLSAAVTLTVTCMGSGWLTLPKAFGIYGLVSGMILMTFAGLNG